MRCISIFVILLAVVSAAITPGQNKFTISRPEGTRTYYVWVPRAYFTSSNPVSVLFGFHGLGDFCTNFALETGFIYTAETYNFLFVYPCATTGALGTAWNAGTCCLSPSSVDDVEFTRLIVQEMDSNFRVNKNLIFTSGFSNGAMFSEILLCEAADIFAAAASISGVVELEPGNDQGLAKCDTDFSQHNRSVSLFHVHGNVDFLVPWGGDALLGFPPIPTNFARWGSRIGCQGNPTNAWTKGPYSAQIYETCPGNATVELVKHDGGGHEWPIDQYFNTTAAIWEFFSNIIHQQPLEYNAEPELR